MFPGNGQIAVPTSSHMGINPSSVQGHHLGRQQTLTLQKQPGPLQNFPIRLQNQQGQPSLGPGSFGQNVPSMQLPGQLPVSQPLTQQNASAGALQAPSAVQSNRMQPVPGQHQLPSNVTPQMCSNQSSTCHTSTTIATPTAGSSAVQLSIFTAGVFQLQQHQQESNLGQQPHRFLTNRDSQINPVPLVLQLP